MEAAVHALEPKIRQILSAPGIDLATISAKRVRKQLLELDPSLSPDFVKAQKEAIDEVIARIYEEISAASHGADDDDEVGPKRKRGDASDAPVAAPKKAKKVKTKQELEDAELARQLQSEYNRGARSSRASASSKGSGAKKGSRKSKKSSATVESDDQENESDEDKPKKKRGGGFNKPYVLSEPLAALLNEEKLARPQIVKALWTYIKANNMQNPTNKREIVCDDAFRAIFKCEKIDMFKMNKELGQHLYEAPAEATS